MTSAVASRTADVRRVLVVTLLLNLAVAAAKIAYGAWSGSLSVRADGFHSLTDSTNNLVGLVGLSLASRPADDDHPYGHEKMEAIAAGLVGLSLLVLAFDVGRGAVQRFAGGGSPPSLGVGAFVVLLGTLIINLAVARYEGRAATRLQSPILASDAAHTRSDAFVTLAVLGSVVGVMLGAAWLDWVAALAVALFIAVAGIGVLRTNLGYLSDSVRIEPSRIEAAACSVPGVASAHKIRTRGIPGAIHVDLHVQIAPHLNVDQAHRVTHWVMDAVRAEFPGVKDVMVHTEPAESGVPYRALPSDFEANGGA